MFWVNILTVILQALLVSRIVKYLGLAGALLALPIVALGSYSTVLAGATLVVLRLAKTVENATDYSIMNTARQMLWLPTSREEKYKAKQAADTFVVRVGDCALGRSRVRRCKLARVCLIRLRPREYCRMRFMAGRGSDAAQTVSEISRPAFRSSGCRQRVENVSCDPCSKLPGLKTVELGFVRAYKRTKLVDKRLDQCFALTVSVIDRGGWECYQRVIATMLGVRITAHNVGGSMKTKNALR